ncbi:beta-fructofuranosidase, insoluble isoenzyme CWINV1-like isoform X2 [Cucumis melo var. makuwa]|uniref:Beta-fructofuranosidase, insoluble isoenzyme CWINV1-like isoform X2 n=3 Tax=Cucumis melo TaxID=3656 RepID=A0A5A7V8Q0_CUCMM|nr:beta-fructofuranosidase, insoluble isoenzyme CWINV1-like isoform X2 [Cucumis melo var. makuwa]
MRKPLNWVIPLCFLLAYNGVETVSNQPYRTAFHFQPPKNWMNGPMYYKGVYHLFYQYNPYSAIWGNITWAHSISYDLVDWVHLEHALSPTEPYETNGCWSGSATILLDEQPSILYTGANSKNQQFQNLALPKNRSDPLLKEWIKSPQNPLIAPVDDIDPSNFRDPTTAWLGQDRLWRVIVGGEIGGSGMAILYRSEDFVNWTRSKSPLHSSNETGMWECPDFYPVSINGSNGLDTSVHDGLIKHVLKASFNDTDHYVLGSYIPGTDTYSVENNFLSNGSDMRYDYGKFYASKSFYDSGKKRRLLWGWIKESDSEGDDTTKGWSGLQSIPRTILLGESGRQLVQWPIKELEKLRTKQVSFNDVDLKSGSVFEVPGITAAQADIEISFRLSGLKEAEEMNSSWNDPQLLCKENNKALWKGAIGPFGLLVLASKDLTEQTAVYFRVFRNQYDKYVVLMCSDQSRSSQREGLEKATYGAFVDMDPLRETISLRSLIDHSIIESFGGNGKACITARVYPKIAINQEAHLYAFNNGSMDVRISRLSGWSMKRAQVVPIQKRRKSPIG